MNSNPLVPDRRRTLALMAGTAALTIAGLSPRSLRAAVADPVVETAYGRVKGYLERDVHHFLGVRYGASTEGRNRFVPPQKPQPWAGVQDALVFGNSASQRNPDQTGAPAPGPAESEDCLFLNVFTRSPSKSARRPVMVWLHGGAFSSGSAALPDFHGGNLVRRGDVVVVGINHRLNGFGYTHLAEFGGPELAASGNAGMLDIIFALEWVRDNIEHFGGDPARVTIFGESGGGQKVSTLLNSPLAKGLFSRAIIESGPALEVIAKADAASTAELFVRELGLTSKNFSNIYSLPTQQLLRAYFTTLAKKGGIVAGLIKDFGPVVDGHFLLDQPFSAGTLAIADNVPVMLGWNRTEMTLFAQGDPAAFTLNEEQMKERVSKIHGNEAGDRIVKTYRGKYPGLTPSHLYFLIWSDYPTMVFCNHIAERRAARNRAPTWLYRFDWETPVMGGKLMSPHTLEIPFAFDNIAATPALTGNGADAFALAAKMSGTWSHFAETGDPNGATGGLPNWMPYTTDSRTTMLISNESKMAQDPQKVERLLFG